MALNEHLRKNENNLKYIYGEALKMITYTLDILFLQSTMFINIHVAFGFALQTL